MPLLQPSTPNLGTAFPPLGSLPIPQLTVAVELHPGDVVSHALHPPARQCGVHHGHVGLPAGAGEGCGHVLLLPLRVRDPQDLPRTVSSRWKPGRGSGSLAPAKSHRSEHAHLHSGGLGGQGPILSRLQRLCQGGVRCLLKRGQRLQRPPPGRESFPCSLGVALWLRRRRPLGSDWVLTPKRPLIGQRFWELF